VAVLSRRYLWLYLTATFLALGALAAFRASTLAHEVWTIGVIVTGLPLVARTVRDALRGHFATDIVASLSIVGAVLLAQPLAGLVIVLMQTGGEALERYAAGRASAALRRLEEAAPRIAHVQRGDGARVEDVAATQVVVGDVLVVLPGELLPCDGTVIDGESELDTSSLTGEPAPIRATAGVRVMSGMINALGSFRYRATAIAEQSQYAKIVEQVRAAQRSKAPLQRLADRYAVWFTPITIAVCAVAVTITHDWQRVLAILVVATPCPLILATPVALIGGINRAARHFIIVRSGGAIEHLARVNTVVFDKTGTLTVGKPRLEGIYIAPRFDRADVLSAAAAAEQRSSHLLARVLVDAVRAEGIPIPLGTDHQETAGQGMAAVVNGRRILVGARGFVVPRTIDGAAVSDRLEHPDATLRAYVAVDDRLAAVLEYADQVRSDLGALLDGLTQDGVDRFMLLSGDHAPIARDIAERVGIQEAYGDLLPPDKADFIELLRAEGRVVMMVGDGINDAPALARADVGVALASQGAGIAAESADAVLLDDRIGRVRDAMRIARRTMHIARQSIVVGLGLSGLAMIVAAFGALPAVAGAALQEAIDIAVILNALRPARAVPASDPGREVPRAGRAAPRAERSVGRVGESRTHVG
jgi:heavy metal translocating P-type ATPase